MNASLERFYRQFTGETDKVSVVLDRLRQGTFRLYIPTPQSEDQQGTIAQIKSTLPYITNVVQKPYITLTTETDMVRAERAGTLSPAGIRQTIRDGKIWKRGESDEVRPEYIYAVSHEDDYNSYENRLVKALIDRLIHMLRVPLRTAKEGIPSLYESYFQVSHLNKLDFMKFMQTDTFHQAKSRTYEDYTDLVRLRSRVVAYRQSQFYKTMDRYPAFTGTPEMTNLFTHNENYRRCVQLWRFLDAQDSPVSTLSAAQVRNAYALFVLVGLLDAYRELGFSLKEDAYILSDDHGWRVSTATLENEHFWVDVWIPQDQIIQITVRAKASKRKEKYKIRLVDEPEITPEAEVDYYVSLYPTPYSDIASCVIPNNLNSLRDLTSIAKSTVLTFASEHSVYGNYCLVCGSTEVGDARGEVTCDSCGAKYSFLSDHLLWLHHFRILR